MKNKKLTISIIVILVVVVAAAAGYFAYGYYCHTIQVNLLKAKVEEFDKLSFDKEKDQKDE